MFPNPSRRTLRSDSSMRKSAYLRLLPFEGPMVPVGGSYIVILRGVAGDVMETPSVMQDRIVIAEPSQHIQMKDGWVSP